MLIWGIGVFLFSMQAEASPTPGSREWVRQKAQQVHKKGQYPSELPQNSLKEPQKNWLTRLLERLFGSRKKRSSLDQGLFSAFRGAGAVLNVVLWILLALSIMLLLYILYRFLLDSFADAKEYALPETSHIEFFGVELPLDKSPEELWREGRLDLALCVLLLRAMHEVGWKDDRRGKSQTAREVIAKIRASDPRHPPLHLLLRLVENVRFGGEEATQEMFQSGQQALQHVKQASPNNIPITQDRP